MVIDDVDRYERLVQELEDAETLHELAREEDDESQEAEIEAALGSLDTELRGLELRSMFSGEHDERDALCTIQAGEGGADAQDWAEMLYRMYVRWAERRGFEVEEEGSTPGLRGGRVLGRVPREGAVRVRVPPGASVASTASCG